MVSGACHSTANTLRPCLQIVKTKPGVKLVSAFFLMVVPNCEYGEDGTFIFADSGLEQNPDPERLAAIAGSSAESFELLVQKPAKVAMLSHSTKGSAKHADVTKVVEATEIAKENIRNYSWTARCSWMQPSFQRRCFQGSWKHSGRTGKCIWYSLIWMLEISDISWFRDWQRQKHTDLLPRVLQSR